MATKAPEIISSEESHIPGLEHSPARLSFSLSIGWSQCIGNCQREDKCLPHRGPLSHAQASEGVRRLLTRLK